MRGFTCLALLTALLVVLIGGCTHIRPFDPATPTGRAEVNAHAERHSTVVVLMNGERAEAQTLRLNADEASWIDAETGEARSAPLAEVRTVRVPARGRGALEGFAIGAGTTLGFSLLGIIIEGEGSGPSLGAPSTGVLVGGGALSFGILGALVGAASWRTMYVAEPQLVDSSALIPVRSQEASLMWTPLHGHSAPQSASLNWEPSARGE